MINLFQPSAGDVELAAIRQVFISHWLGAGSEVEGFEQAFADYINRPSAGVVAITSCTEGLFQAILALGLGPGDEVILPTISFHGAAHAVRSSGARVVLCDVDAATLNPSVEHVADVLTQRTRAILVLHYGGGPGDTQAIAGLSRDRSLSLIEDAACGLGAVIDGQMCGTLGDIGVWSFDSMKIITTGDGGMVWCRDPGVAVRVRSAIRLGDARSGFARRVHSGSWWEIDPQGIGRRAAMNDMAAAMGLVQLERLPGFLARRREVAAAYDVGLSDLTWLSVPGGQPLQAARIFYWIQTDATLRVKLATHLLERGIYTSFRYWPLHRTDMYRSEGAFPGADHAADSTLMLPLHQGLSDQDVELILDAIHAFVPQRFSR
jgi:dTDP-4-amino-4,6-dideoxygalactose transaminase